MSEFIWLDLETTGLDPDRDIVLEFAAGIANDGPGGDFQAIEIVQSVIDPKSYATWRTHERTETGFTYDEVMNGPTALTYMDPFVRNMHTRNGLLAELERPELCCTIEEADEHLAALAPDGKPSLAGNSVHFDLAFIKKHMPKFAARLSHRVFDVSTLLRAERTYGDSHAAINVPASAHRAREDVLASLETAGRFVGAEVPVIAIDPGGDKKGCAGARFEGASLVAVATDVRDFEPLDRERVVVERPQQDGRSRAVPPQILIELAWNGALLAGRYAGPRGTVAAYTPAAWKCGPKGNESIAKAIHHSRLVKALGAGERLAIASLFPDFQAMIAAAVRKGALSRWAKDSNAHYPRGSALPDVLDAVGLGLFDLGRIDQKGNPT